MQVCPDDDRKDCRCINKTGESQRHDPDGLLVEWVECAGRTFGHVGDQAGEGQDDQSSQLEELIDILGKSVILNSTAKMLAGCPVGDSMDLLSRLARGRVL